MNHHTTVDLRLILILTMLCVPLYANFAEPVHIPDPILRAAVAETLNVQEEITRLDMQRLVHLNLHWKDITDLTGLEAAVNLEHLMLSGNPVSDVSPLRGLTRLRALALDYVGWISDISFLAEFTDLFYLDLAGNQVADVSALANLVNLEVLRLNNNRIADVGPLAGLTWLNELYLTENQIFDHSPLDWLTLEVYEYDQTCELAPLPLEPRIENRTYPSVFRRWASGETIVNRPDLTPTERMALYDLWYSGLRFGQYFREVDGKFFVSGMVDEAIKRRDAHIAVNPNMVFLADIRVSGFGYWVEPPYPDDWGGWLRDKNGDIVLSCYDCENPDQIIDWTTPVAQDRMVNMAIAVDRCGLYDGVFFDWWGDNRATMTRNDGTPIHGLEAENEARVTILERIRAAVRPNFLIMVNSGGHKLPVTAPYVNGGAMETALPNDVSVVTELQKFYWNQAIESLIWLGNNTREPRINGIEGFSIVTQPRHSPDNLRWVRAFTTASLTLSDGYVGMVEPDTWDDDWYAFWDRDLGRPAGPKLQLYDEAIPGLYIREYTNGWAVFNHTWAPQRVRLPEAAQSAANGSEGREHALEAIDGDIYLRIRPSHPDVNGDGVVHVFDLVLVAQGFGTDKAGCDLNRDGLVNILDLVLVANGFGEIGGGE